MPGKVLLLAHPFPPAGGAGVQRTSKLVKFLPETGWQPTVLTTDPHLYFRRFGLEDRQLLSDIPAEIRVLRVPSLEELQPPRHLLRIHQRFILPDRSRLWNPAAFFAAIAEHARKRFDLIYATGNPFSTFLLAHRLGALLQRPYVIDFRDAWVIRSERVPLKNPAQERRVRAMERRVLQGATAAVFTTHPIEQDYLDEYPFLKGKTQTILNGFDHEDYTAMPNPRSLRGPEDPVNFVYTGSFPWHMRPDKLFEAFEAARNASTEFARRGRLIIFGKPNFENPKYSSLAEMIKHFHLSDVAELRGYLTHPEVVLEQRNADVLVLLGSSDRHQGGKVPEYVAAGRPILAMVPDTSAALTMIRRIRHYYQVGPTDVAGARDALLRLFESADRRRPQARLPPVPRGLSDLTRIAAAEQMARLFEACGGGG
jgi:glycosyltransferase involved in cell wall biosynthesis